jgi:hypothetical protein
LAGEAGPPASGRIRLFWPNLRPAGQKLARTAGFRSAGRDPAILCRIPATLPEFVYAKYKKIFLYYFIIFRTRQTPKNDFDEKYFSKK